MLDENEKQIVSLESDHPNPREHNFNGDEFNESVLDVDNSSSALGGKNLSYSVKDAEVVESVAPTATTAIATTAAAGVVIATVVIFTSILGGQYKLVDNSLILSLYRDQELNTINLDYNFDIQYDKTGTLYVKLLSAAHSLTAEPIEFVVDENNEIIYETTSIDDENSDEGSTIYHTTEKTKEVFTATISGTFTDLIETNEYTFAITSLIDGVEGQIYTQQIYVPSSYVNATSYDYEVVMSDNDILVNYYYFVEYEAAAEAYVELKHIDPLTGEINIEETSEIYLLSTDNQSHGNDGNRFTYYIDGSFSGLVQDNEYILSLIYRSNNKTNIACSQRFLVHEEVIGFDVDYVTCSFSADANTLSANYNYSVVPEHNGQLIEEFIDSNGNVLYSATRSIATSSERYETFSTSLDDVTINQGETYSLVLTSIINGNTKVVYDEDYIASGVFATYDAESFWFEAIQYTLDGESHHKITCNGYFESFADLSDFRVAVIDGNNVYETEYRDYLFADYNDGENYFGVEFSEEIEIPNGSGNYSIEIRGNYGKDEVIYSDVVEEITPLAFVIAEDSMDINFEDDGNGGITLSVSFWVILDKSGYVYVELTSPYDEEVYQCSSMIYVDEGDTGSEVSEGKYHIRDIYFSDIEIDQTYTITAISSIDGYAVPIYIGEHDAGSTSFGYSSVAAVNSINYGSYYTHTVGFEFYYNLSCEMYFEFENSNTGSIDYTSSTYNCVWSENSGTTTSSNSVTINETITDSLTPGADYNINVYGTWLNNPVLASISHVTIEEYGITCDTSNIVSDYVNETITVPVTIIDLSSHLSDYDATITYTDLEEVEQTVHGTYDSSLSTFEFSLAGCEKGTYGILEISAVDWNINTSGSGSYITTTFIKQAIWY